jgi:cell division protein ZipA
MALRTILLILGVLIILGIAFDGWRRKQRQRNVAQQKNIEPRLNLRDIDASAEFERSEPSIAVLEPKQFFAEAEPLDEEIADAYPPEEYTSPIMSREERPRDPYSVEIQTVDTVRPANDPALQKVSESASAVYSANQSLPKNDNRDKKAAPVKAAPPQPEIMMLTVMSPTSTPFSGYDLVQALEANNLHFGEMDIYHRHKYKNGKGPLYFSVASAVSPGTLNRRSLGTLSTPALALFMQLDNAKYDRIVFKQMLATAHQLARALGGVVCDNKRVPLREATMQYYTEKLNL